MTKANEPLLVLGIDTSNYTTSLALVDTAGTLIREERKLLTVREGERGLRQQEALFQHVQNFPALSKALFAGIDPSSIAAVSVSTQIRRGKGNAGLNGVEVNAGRIEVDIPNLQTRDL